MGTDTGWSRAAGESSGRWRTIIDRATGRNRSERVESEPTAPLPHDPDATTVFPAPIPPAPRTPAAYPPPPTQAYPSAAYQAASTPTYSPPSPPGYTPPRGQAVASAPLPPAPAAPMGIAAKSGSPADRAVSVLRRNLGVPRVVAFANPKGGVHKTTATVLAAAAIGGARGRGVVAWDDNELRGTLGLRAGSARHAKTIRHLVAELAEVELNTGPALTARIDDFLRHASDGTYDVLAGEEDPRFAWRLDPPTVRRVLDLLTRTHEVICVDTGNNVESGNWRTIMEAADQLVITTVPREDSAFSADWMMDVLVEAGREELVAKAVTIVSMTTPKPGPMQEDLIRHFRSRNRAVCVVPYDPVLEHGGWIDHTVLAPATRQAWLEAAATIMEPLGT